MLRYYKYVSHEGLMRLLDTLKLRFTQPSAFNDPFEMPAFRAALDWQEKGSAETGLTMVRVADTVGKAGSGGAAAATHSAAATVAEPWAHAWHPWFWFPMPGSGHSETPGERLSNDERRAVQEAAARVDGQYGAFCLTSTRTNLLMWAHYADEHRGAAVEIDVLDPALRRPGDQLGQVEYIGFRPPVAADEEAMARHFFYKSQDWQYEQEFRVVRRLTAREGAGKDRLGRPIFLSDLPGTALRGITLGARFDADAETVRAALSKASPTASLEQAGLDKLRFSIGFSPVPGV